MTVFASRETFLMRRTLATEPARCVGPCMTLASSSTSPSSLGRPPYPTESSFGSSSTTVTAATTASSVSPPFLRISMPLSSACKPLALEMMSGRLPCAAGARLVRVGASAPFEREPPNSWPVLATALPASEVRKNLRRDQSSIWKASSACARQYTSDDLRQLKANRKNQCMVLTGNGGAGGEFAFPAGNDDASDAIAENGDGRSPHVHELIDGEEKEKRFHGQVKRSCHAENNQQRSARHAGGSFAADQQRQNHQNLLADAEVQSRRLHNKKQRQGLVETRAVHIKAVAGGKNERDDFARHAERFQLLDRARQCCFRARGGKSNGDRLGNGVDKSLDGNAGPQHDRQQDTDDEKRECDVHCCEQFQKREQHSQAEVTHCIRHCPKDAEWRGIHHQVCELEHRFGKALREGQHRAAFGFGNQYEPHGKKHAEHHDLQNLAFSNRFRNVLRKNIRDELRRRVRRNIQRLRC